MPRGGNRDGTGRPPGRSGQRYPFNLTREAFDIVKSWREGTRSRRVSELIEIAALAPPGGPQVGDTVRLITPEGEQGIGVVVAACPGAVCVWWSGDRLSVHSPSELSIKREK